MSYLRILRRIHRIFAWLMARCDQDGKAWAELAWHDGHIAFRQLRYAERVQTLIGWQPVEIATRRPTNWMTSQPTTTINGGTNVTVTWKQA